MMKPEDSSPRLQKLIEREKELNCLYRVENILIKDKLPFDDMLLALTRAIPPGWQYPETCRCRIHYEGKTYEHGNFLSSGYAMFADIVVSEHVAGSIEVAYAEGTPFGNRPVFLPEERTLLNTIAATLGQAIFRRKLRSTLEVLENARTSPDMKINEDQVLDPSSDRHWKWRYNMVEHIAAHIDMQRFGIKALYLIGSTKNASAGPASDIDLLVHTEGDSGKEEKFRYWLEGWGLCLGEINFMRTGHGETRNIIDLHMICDEDIEKKNSYASLIGAVSDRARLIKDK